MPLVFKYRVGGVVTELPQGYDFVVGIYVAPGTPVYIARLSDSTIVKDKDDPTILRLMLSHDVTVNMVGDYTMEVTVFESSMSDVSHSKRIVKLHSEPRYNNEHLVKA